MTDATLNLTAAPIYEGTNRLILGIVLAVVTFWLFAQTTLNVAPTMRDDLHITNSEATSRSASPHCFPGSLSSRESAHGFRMRDDILTVRPPPVCTLPRFHGEPDQGDHRLRVVSPKVSVLSDALMQTWSSL